MLQQNENFKWAAIVPLVGGMTLGCREAFGKDPEYLLSYSVFQDNDSHIRNYLPNVPYYLLDKENVKVESVDVVHAVCPCAGLSMLNNSKTMRGSNSPTNEWLYKSANYVLENIKPKVFWGENAPGLFTNMGEGVQDKLLKIAAAHNYSFSIIKTNTNLHGIPQNRPRTFYFFWNSKTAPIMNWIKQDEISLSDFLSKVPSDATYHDVESATLRLTEDPLFKWFKANINNRQLLTKSNQTILAFIGKDTSDNTTTFESRFLKVKEWIQQNSTDLKRSEKVTKKIDKILSKASEGLGFWDDSPHFYTNQVNAIISKNMDTAIHPTEDRYLTHRENMHLMGLPMDFKLVNDTFYHYTQNVPVTTAKDWCLEVIKFLNNKLPLSDSVFIKQNNISKTNEFMKTEESLKYKYEYEELF